MNSYHARINVWLDKYEVLVEELGMKKKDKAGSKNKSAGKATKKANGDANLEKRLAK